jgi:hypothetical protein
MSIEDIIRAIVREELLALGVGAVKTYDRRHLPPGFASAEAFTGECRRLKLPAKYRPGRSWVVPADVWEAARTRARAARPAPDPDDATLERAGLRLTRRPR